MKNTFQLIDSTFDEFFTKKFIYYLSNGQIIELLFRKKHIPHLIGIHKFQDHIPTIASYLNPSNYQITADNVLSNLISQSIEVDDLPNLLPANLWNNRAKDRIEYFTSENIYSLLTTAKAFHFDHTRSKNKKGKYATFRVIGIDYLHLVFAKNDDIPNEPYFLNSFFVIQEKDTRLGKPVSVKKLEIFELQGDGYILHDTIDHDQIARLINSLKKNVKEYSKVNNMLYFDPSKEELLEKIHVLYPAIAGDVSILKTLSGYQDSLSRPDVKQVVEFLRTSSLLK